jgi:molybdopterin/thiamine biosynthesis adenylyltransferase
MKYNIIIVGCGGTGGNLIKELGRFLYGTSIRNSCSILLIDGDLVEKQNVSRQPFLPEDVGRKKAAVMAEILQEAFQITCSYYPEYLNHAYELEKFEKEDYVTILIGCVDNHACRKVLHAYFQKSISCFYLDSANEYSIGEVVVGARIAGSEIFPDRVHYFPEILQDQSVPRSEESCQQMNVRQPQHLVTNLFAANLLLKCVVEILSEQEWNGGIYYFDAFKGYSVFREKQ